MICLVGASPVRHGRLVAHLVGADAPAWAVARLYNDVRDCLLLQLHCTRHARNAGAHNHHRLPSVQQS
jgi:hypothetical protein